MDDFISINGIDYPSNLTKEELAKYPFDHFKGKIYLFNDEEIEAEAIYKMYQSPVIGFDCESKPSFKKGIINRVSLIQLANADMAVLIRIYSSRLPDEVIHLLESKKVFKAGIGITHDMTKLNPQNKIKPHSLIDLNVMAQKAGFIGIGARKLCAALLGFNINKSAQISNWEADILSKQQIQYAATDAWICYEIYHKLALFPVKET